MSLVRRPTTVVVGVCLGVFVGQVVGSFVGFGVVWFGLSFPLLVRPWTIVTSVFAHADSMHLAVNVFAFWLFGRVIERGSSAIRFYGFVLVVGVVGGIAELSVGSVLGDARLVLGLSGVVFGLFGYLVTSNRVTGVVFDRVRIQWRWQLVVFTAVAVLVSMVTATDHVAVVAHFTGLFLGLVAGRFRLLRSR